MAVLTKIKKWFRVVSSYLKHTKRDPADTFVFIVVFLVVALLCWLTSACSSHHYFSINAEEMTNPVIEYSDSASLSNPF